MIAFWVSERCFLHVLSPRFTFISSCFGKIVFICLLGVWEVSISTIQTEKQIKFGFLYKKFENEWIKSSTVLLKWYWNCSYRNLFFPTRDLFYSDGFDGSSKRSYNYSVKSNLGSVKSSGLILFFGKKRKN